MTEDNVDNNKLEEAEKKLIPDVPLPTSVERRLHETTHIPFAA